MYSNLYIPSHPYTFVLKWPFDWVGGVSSFQKFLWIYSEMIHGGFIGILRTTFSVRQIYRPSSDSEAATMYKLKGQSLNRRTGQGFKCKELVRPAGPSNWSVYRVAMLPKVTKSYQKLPKVAKGCQMLPNVAKRCKLWNVHKVGTNGHTKGQVGFLSCCRS